MNKEENTKKAVPEELHDHDHEEAHDHAHGKDKIDKHPYIYTHTHDGHTHTHIIEDHEHDGHMHSHEHTEGCDQHGHTHSHEHTKAVLNRLARASGHLEAVKRMIEDGRDCTEVLIQLAAVISALNNTAKLILKDHIEHCVIDAVASNDHEALEQLNKAVDSFIK